MYNPFFDPSQMTIKEIQEKIDKTSIQLNNARIYGMNCAIIETMEGIINACNDEIINRLAAREAKEMRENPCIFDPESYLESPKEKAQNGRKRKSKYQPEW